MKTKLILLPENLDVSIVSLPSQTAQTRNLVSVEANCQLSVQRLTPQLCSQVSRVLLLLHPVLLERPHLSSERMKETEVLTEQAFRQHGALRVA